MFPCALARVRLRSLAFTLAGNLPSNFIMNHFCITTSVRGEHFVVESSTKRFLAFSSIAHRTTVLGAGTQAIVHIRALAHAWNSLIGQSIHKHRIMCLPLMCNHYISSETQAILWWVRDGFIWRRQPPCCVQQCPDSRRFRRTVW